MVKDVDAVFVSSPPISILILAYFYTKVKKIKLIIDLRDLWPEVAISLKFLKKGLITKILEKFIIKTYTCASKIFINTPAFQETLEKDYKIANNKICYIPNGFDIDGNLLIKNTLKRLDFNFKIFYAGLLGFAQNVDLILNLAEICQKQKENINFFIIGDGPLKNYAKNKINELRLNNITLFDYQSKHDLFNLINECDLGLITYQINDAFRKNIPSKIFDYMFLEKPILINLEGQASTIIDNADCGYCIETDDAEKLYNYIKDNSLKLKEKGINGFNYLEEHFNKKDLLSALEQKLREI